ncbi:uncharacterized protein J8A68_005724 [[Candida] subhashii]|uniref:Uncharacterized protein n=1 Tax=[Candida] subhashii TaxID=561895 RepID=A0A8J5QBX9_9ASCO|nr:uncharacterized protein J8A68_005724 [[Candida] subhashii]KAG7660762.1 hypothetical protein J8A68_005724 [[Candida] subhashii]
MSLKPTSTLLFSSDDDSQELLAVDAAAASTRASPVPHRGGSSSNENRHHYLDKLSQLSQQQYQSTDTTWKKLQQFLKINLLGYRNEFEKYVINNEPSDCSLIAKYSKITEIDLSRQPTISTNSVILNTLHIPHPIVNFMRNEANQKAADELNISKELQESPILVFIHGMGGQMSQFEPLMGLLSQCSEILSLDLPGFGNSKIEFNDKYKIISEISEEDKLKVSNSIKRLSWDDFTSDNVANIIYEFIIQQIPQDKKIVLIGHSMGTHLSIKVGKKLPKHKIEGLILLSPPGLHDDIHVQHPSEKHQFNILHLFQMFKYTPWIFDYFRSWDRLEGLQSESVTRQLTREGTNTTIYNKLRQLRWNLDIDSTIVLKYAKGFKKAALSDLVSVIDKFNDNPQDKHTYEKTLLICGTNDQITPIEGIYQIDKFLTTTFQNRKVSSTIEIKDVGHSLLLIKPEYICGMILNHIESKFPQRLHLSPSWVLQKKALISGDKWGLKNELKWQSLKPISDNITRRNGQEIAPLLGMKTLREGDETHSPIILESQFYSNNNEKNSSQTPQGNLIAIIDISADIPPYNPKSFNIIKYYKCATVSKVTPDQVAIRRFIQLVDDILSSTDVENPLIAVHCHYGFNRTGFLICCYLIEELGWSVQEAVEGFKVAKPPGIKHPHFIDALYVRYENNN